MQIRWTLVAMAIPSLVAMVALYLAVDNIARAGPGSAPAAAPDVVPAVVSYQGHLTDPGTGQPVSDAVYSMHFGIFDAAVAGAQLWEEPVAPAVVSVPVVGGVFAVLLGSVIPLSPTVFAGGDAYLEVEVNGETLAPRQPITTVAYAMVAETLAAPATIMDDGTSAADLVLEHAIFGPTIELDSHGGTINLGAVGVDGDVWVNSASGVRTIRLDGTYGYVTLGSMGEAGDLEIKDDTDVITIDIDGEGGLVTLGAMGEDGDLEIRDDTDVITIDINGNTGIIDLGAVGQDGDLRVRDDTDVLTISLDGNTGNVTYDGALVGAFPRPAYDSGWVDVAQASGEMLTHSVGGDPDDYFVDFRCDDDTGFIPAMINNIGIGRDDDGSVEVGASYSWLGSNTVWVARAVDDTTCGKIQVRIWVIK